MPAVTSSQVTPELTKCSKEASPAPFLIPSLSSLITSSPYHQVGNLLLITALSGEGRDTSPLSVSDF